MRKDDYIDPYLEIYDNDLHHCLERLLDQNIGERAKTCLREYYFDSLTLEKIGKKHRVSTERVRQIIHRGLRQLRSSFTDNKILQELADLNYPGQFYSKNYVSNSRSIKIDPSCHIEVVSPNKFMKINEFDTPKMKFKKFLLNYPHLMKYNWSSDFSFNYINYSHFLVFIPSQPNLLYQVTDLKKNKEVIYKWTLFNS
jgi:hypothetical protein